MRRERGDRAGPPSPSHDGQTAARQRPRRQHLGGGSGRLGKGSAIASVGRLQKRVQLDFIKVHSAAAISANPE